MYQRPGHCAEAYALALQPDGPIVAAGWSESANGTGQCALARYSVNGLLGPSFGTGGKVRTDFGGDRGQAYLAAVAVQPDGQIAAVGSFLDDQWEQYFALTRYQGR